MMRELHVPFALAGRRTEDPAAMGLRRAAGGHVWTIVGGVWPTKAPPSEAWSCTTPAPWGTVQLRGHLSRVEGARTIAIVVHGFAGDADSRAVVRTAAACRAAGMSSLRLHLRGADGWGEDIYHAGLVDDVLAAIEHPEVAAYDDIVVIGHSLGGHMALHAGRIGAPKLRAVVAIGSPLDLSISCAAIDRLRATGYREFILRTLRQIYRAFARRHPALAPADVALVDRVRTIRGWDELVVIPRHGFASVAEYHETQSMAPHLAKLTVPALYLGSERDPMVPFGTVEPILRSAPSTLEIHTTDGGGHMVFPPGFTLGFEGARGADAQLVAWLRQHVA